MIEWQKEVPKWGGDVVEPPESKKEEGYVAGDKPPAKWENWLRKGTYEALIENRLAIEQAMEKATNIDVPVKSVNEKTGAVKLTASDVGASPVGHVHAYGTLTGIPGTFPPSAHTHTPAQVGLGYVLNYGIASTAEAQAGASNAKYMTPFLVNVAVKHLATTGGISMVKSVQRGVVATRLDAGVKTVPISAVNVNKSSANLLTSISKGESGGANPVISIGLAGPTSLRIDASFLISEGEISWEVIEYY